VDPITLAALASAGLLGAGVNYLGQKEASKASDKAMNQLAGLRGEAYDLLNAGIDPSQLEQLGIISPIEMSYTPEELQYIAGSDPLMYDIPQDVKAQMVSDSPEARAIQLAALKNIQTRAKEGLTAEDQQQYLQASRRAGEMARGREGAIMESLQARGMGGSGIEAAMRQMASQGAAQDLSSVEAERATAQAKARALAELQSMQGASQLRGQDIGLSETNADIINRFAMENSARNQAVRNANIDKMNQSAQSNTEEKRRIQAANTAAKNEAQRVNQQRKIEGDIMRQQSQNEKINALYGARSQKANALAASKLGATTDIAAQGAANAESMRNIYGGFANVPMQVASLYPAFYQQKKKEDDFDAQKEWI
jgi:hypothetical protein